MNQVKTSNVFANGLCFLANALSPLLQESVDVQSTRLMRFHMVKMVDVNMELNWFNQLENWYDGIDSLLSQLLRSSAGNTEELESTGGSKA